MRNLFKILGCFLVASRRHFVWAFAAFYITFTVCLKKICREIYNNVAYAFRGSRMPRHVMVTGISDYNGIIHSAFLSIRFNIYVSRLAFTASPNRKGLENRHESSPVYLDNARVCHSSF